MQRDLYQKDLEKDLKSAGRRPRKISAPGKERISLPGMCQGDARLKKIIPTEKAVCLRGQLLKSIERTEERIRQGIPEEDLKVFFRVLKQISANLSSWEEENKMGKEEIER